MSVNDMKREVLLLGIYWVPLHLNCQKQENEKENRYHS